MRCLVLLCLLPLALPATTIKEAYSRYMEAGQFQFLREFFTGREYTGRRFIVRTDPANRAGHYFTLSLDEPVRDLPPGTVAVLELIVEDSIATREIRFELDDAVNRARGRRLLLGLTDPVWQDPSRDLLAWRVQLRQGETVLAEWKSFLWEMP